MFIVTRYRVVEPTHVLDSDVDLLFLKDMEAMKELAKHEGFPILARSEHKGYMCTHTFQRETAAEYMDELHIDAFMVPINIKEAFYDNKGKDSDD